MTYEEFLEKTNIINTNYEQDRQELADKYTADVIKLSEKRDKEVTKLFEDYKNLQKEVDNIMSDWIIDEKEQKKLNKLKK